VVAVADNIIVTRDALTAWLDQGEQLDRALADVRYLSRLIAQATEQAEKGVPCSGGDTWGDVIAQLSLSRNRCSERVTELLKVTSEVLGHE